MKRWIILFLLCLPSWATVTVTVIADVGCTASSITCPTSITIPAGSTNDVVFFGALTTDTAANPIVSVTSNLGGTFTSCTNSTSSCTVADAVGEAVSGAYITGRTALGSTSESITLTSPPTGAWREFAVVLSSSTGNLAFDVASSFDQSTNLGSAKSGNVTLTGSNDAGISYVRTQSTNCGNVHCTVAPTGWTTPPPISTTTNNDAVTSNATFTTGTAPTFTYSSGTGKAAVALIAFKETGTAVNGTKTVGSTITVGPTKR